MPCPKELPLDKAAVIGCCVTTGVGAAVNAAKVEPGATVAVVGCGGVGLNVIMGARLAGARQIIAVDISEGALEFAMQFGAPTPSTPASRTAREGEGDYRRAGRRLHLRGIRVRRNGGDGLRDGPKGRHRHGGGHPARRRRTGHRRGVSGPPGEDAEGHHYYGSARLQSDMPRMVDLYMSGQLNLDALVTRTYHLEEINQGLRRPHPGRGGPGVITRFD